MAEETEVKEIAISDLSSADFKEARKNGLEMVPKPEPKVEEQEEKPKAKGGFQARIDRLIKQNATLEAALETERSRKPAAEKEVVPEVKGRPVKADFAGREDEYIEALVDWTAEQKIAKAKQDEARAAEAAQQKETFDAYNRKVAEAKAVHEDFVEVVGQDIVIPIPVQLAVIDMDNGPEVAYFLGSNPELCEELMKMKTSKAVAEVWKISEKLGESEGEEEEEAEEKPAAKAKIEEKPGRKAPEPIRPVGNGKTRSSVPLNEMSMADYKKARQAGRIT